MKKTTYKMNAGGNLVMYFRFVEIGSRIVIKVWDNFFNEFVSTGNEDINQVFVEVDMSSESFTLGYNDDPTVFYLNEFSPAN